MLPMHFSWLFRVKYIVRCVIKGYKSGGPFLSRSLLLSTTYIIHTHKWDNYYLLILALFNNFAISRLTIVSREAKKKQAVRDEQVSYLHVAPL